MWQEILRIPVTDTRAIPIYGYGLMMVLGFIAAAQLARYLANRVGLNGEDFVNAAILALVAGIIGARASHVLENLGEFTRSDRTAWENLVNIVNLRSGGLTFYGGFLLAFPTLVLYAVRKKIPVRVGMDIVAPALMLALGLGRVGCFFNGCCQGDECDLPWAVRFPYASLPYADQFAAGTLRQPPPMELLDTAQSRPRLLAPEKVQRDPALRELARQQRSNPLHPAQLYSAVNAFLISGITLAYFTLAHAAGRGFALMLMLKGVSRYILELLRVEPPVLGSLSLSMVISLGVFALGVTLWVIFGWMRDARDRMP